MHRCTDTFHRTVFIFFAATIIVGVPMAAWANAGTALMMAGFLHLTIGNAILGVVEGLALASMFRLHDGKCIALSIIANYASAFMGGVFGSHALMLPFTVDLYSAKYLFWVWVFTAYVLTLLLEFPFAFLLLRKDPQRLRKSIRGTLIIQTISCALLFTWYWKASVMTIYTETKIVAPAALTFPNNVALYYISSEDGDVYVTPLSEMKPRKAFDLNSTDRNDQIFAQESATDSNQCQLIARLQGPSHEKPLMVTVSDSSIPKEKVGIAYPNPSAVGMKSDPGGTWGSYGLDGCLGTAQESPWEISTDVWAVSGLRGTHSETHEHFRIAAETPFIWWYVRNATHLPGDLVIFQLGEDQICVYDINTNRVALLVKGRGPLPVLAENESL